MEEDGEWKRIEKGGWKRVEDGRGWRMEEEGGWKRREDGREGRKEYASGWRMDFPVEVFGGGHPRPGPTSSQYSPIEWAG